jgi:hypothetical protein
MCRFCLLAGGVQLLVISLSLNVGVLPRWHDGARLTHRQPQ